MRNISSKQIFLSYAWANREIADAIDNDFKSVGISFLRDVRDIQYTENIKDFMNKIGKTDFVVMIISDEYINSENCMYEVTELLGSLEFEKRILPVICNNAKVYSTDEQGIYYDLWQEKLKKAQKLFVKHPNEKTNGDKEKINDIYRSLGEFFQKITYLKSEKYEDLKAKNYKPMLDKIGFDNEEVLEKVMAVRNIEDKEEQELAFEKLLEKYPGNQNILFYRAFEAEISKQFKKAKKYYEDVLRKYKNHIKAHNNYANLLIKHFSDHVTAKKHFEYALLINPQNLAAHVNFGIFLCQYCSEYEAGQKHFEKAIEIDEDNATAHYNYAYALENCLHQSNKADEHFKTVFQINPNFHEIIEEYVKRNPDSAKAHYDFAFLLANYLNNEGAAKWHYRKAIELDPHFKLAEKNLAKLSEGLFASLE